MRTNVSAQLAQFWCFRADCSCADKTPYLKVVGIYLNPGEQISKM